MRSRMNKELFLQIAILLACLLALITSQSETFVEAQINCPGPLLVGETPSGELTGEEITNSWTENSDVIVKIDDEWNEEERKQIKDGIEKWNGTVSQQTCSKVTFSDFGEQTFTDKNVYPPYPGLRTIYVTKTSGTTFADMGNGARGALRECMLEECE